MKRVSDQLTARATNLLAEAYRDGYTDACSEAASRLESLAAVVPNTVTKAWLIEQIGRQADLLRRKVME